MRLSTLALPLLAAHRIAAQWCGCSNAPADCLESPQDLNVEERLDCGPYVPRYPCSLVQTDDGCSSDGASLSLTGIENDNAAEVNPSDPSFNTEDLDVYKTRELEILAETLKNDPLYPDEGEQKLDLLYCGMPAEEVARHDVPVYTSDLYKRSWGSVFSGIKWPTLSSGPKKPIFPKKLAPPNIPVVFNVFATKYTTQVKVTDAILDTAVAELNSAYKAMKITFYRDQQVYRHTDPEDADLRRFTQHQRGGSANDAFNNRYMMNGQFRHGGKDSIDQPPSTKLNGFCAFPYQTAIDGCAIAMDVMTGLSHQYCDTTSRGTLVHETGHWFGLKHSHDEEADGVCKGSNDIAVITQVPSKGRFCDTQHPCSKGKNPTVQTNTNVRMSKYMSYAFSRGAPYVKDIGPWVAEQQSKAYTNFYTFRYSASSSKRDAHLPRRAGPSLYARLLKYRARQARALNGTVAARGILASRPNIREELLAICETPWSENDASIDATVADKNEDSSKIPEAKDGSTTTTPGSTTGSGDGTGKTGGSSGSGNSGSGSTSSGSSGSSSGSGSGSDEDDGDDNSDGDSSSALLGSPS